MGNFRKNDINHILKIATNPFIYDAFYTYNYNHMLDPEQAFRISSSYYKFKKDATLANDIHINNFKIHDVVFIRGFYQLSQTMCQELKCQNPNGFGIVTDVNDDSLEILFGKSNDKFILFNVKKEYVKLWLRTTALSLDLISTRIVKKSEDKLAQLLLDFHNNKNPQVLPSRSLIRPSLSENHIIGTSNTELDDDDMIKAFSTTRLNELINMEKEDSLDASNWRDVDSLDSTNSQITRGGKTKLRKSKKNKNYKNKTIKGGKKNKKSKVHGGSDTTHHIIVTIEKGNNIKYHDEILDKNDIENTNNEILDSVVTIDKGFENDSGVIAYLATDADRNNYYFIQGTRTILLK